MKLIKLPRLRLAQLQIISESTLTMTEKTAELAVSRQNVENAFTPFVTGMLKDKASAEKKRELDQSRDNRTSGFFAALYAEENFDHKDPVILKSLTDLLKVANKYGPGIIKLPRDEETAAIDNLLGDIGQIDITPLLETGITRWIPKIEAENEAYRVAAAKYITDSVLAEASKAASVLAPALEDELELLYKKLFATIIVSPTPELEKTHAELKKLVDSMR